MKSLGRQILLQGMIWVLLSTSQRAMGQDSMRVVHYSYECVEDETLERRLLNESVSTPLRCSVDFHFDKSANFHGARFGSQQRGCLLCEAPKRSLKRGSCDVRS